MIFNVIEQLGQYQYATVNIINFDTFNDCVCISIHLDEYSKNKIKLISGDDIEYITIYLHGNDTTDYNDIVFDIYNDPRLEYFWQDSHCYIVPVGLALKLIKEYSPGNVNEVDTIYNASYDIKVIDAHITSHQQRLTELDTIKHEYGIGKSL